MASHSALTAGTSVVSAWDAPVTPQRHSPSDQVGMNPPRDLQLPPFFHTTVVRALSLCLNDFIRQCLRLYIVSNYGFQKASLSLLLRHSHPRKPVVDIRYDGSPGDGSPKRLLLDLVPLVQGALAQGSGARETLLEVANRDLYSLAA